MGRLLTMAECHIESSMRTAYLAALDARRSAVEEYGAHFWVFEHASNPGRFIEFTEGSSESSIRDALGDATDMVLWREVEGG